jgi:acyl-coenzyme A synthetase/AMP-(fatty) acid ligase
MSNLYRIIVGGKVWNENKIALISDDINYTYMDLLNISICWSNFFIDNGIGNETRVAFLIDQPAEFVFATIGLLRVGGIVVPIDTTLKIFEIQKICADLKIKYVIISSPQLNKHDLPGIDFVFCINEFNNNDCINKQIIDRSRVSDNTLHEALYLITSGTTGKPKYVIHTFKSILNATQISNKAYNSNSKDIIFNAAPVFHSAGLMPVLSAIDSDATCILMRKFLPKTFLQIISKFKPNVVKAPAFMYRIISQMPQPEDLDISSVKEWYTGSSKLLAEEKQKIKEKYAFKISEMYATSETSLIAVEQQTENENIADEIICKVIESVTIKVDENGKIFVSTPAMALAYIEAETGEKIYLDQYIFTGDIGRIIDDDKLIIEGRESNRINLAGKKISADEINNVLALHPNIKESLVFGLNNNSSDDEIVACIIPVGYLNEDEIRCHCRKYLSDYKVPRHIYFYSSFPKGKLGKIIINKLKEETHERVYS